MAIDGIKIIDSDLAHDVYGEFMDLYDADVEIAEIKQKIEKWLDEDLDESEFEIFITAYALALWETGNLTGDIFNEVQNVIDNGAGVAMWLAECGEDEAKNRQKVLEKFLNKISSPKKTPRKRKKCKKITNFIFQTNDVVTFQVSDKSFRAAILASIFQYRGMCIYQFIPTSYMSPGKPTEPDIKNSSVFINKMGCGYNRETVKQMQPGIEKFWASDNKFSIPFMLGLSLYGIEHKDLINFSEKFEVIGNVKIRDHFKEVGSLGYEDTFEDFSERFKDIINREVKIFKKEMVNINDLI